MARYNADGTLDATFGNSGIVQENFGTSYGSLVEKIAIQSDGGIQLYGRAVLEDFRIRFAVARHDPNGILFTATINENSPYGDSVWGSAMAVQPDGKVITGYQSKHNPVTGNDDFLIARYLGAQWQPDLKIMQPVTPLA